MADQGWDIDIDEDGDVRIEGKNFKGPECDELIRDISRALGSRVKFLKKPEFHLLKPTARKVAR
jgi:hypothetical protein